MDGVTIPGIGETCAACAARVRKKVARGAGVGEASVHFGTERATVEYDAVLRALPGLILADTQPRR